MSRLLCECPWLQVQVTQLKMCNYFNYFSYAAKYIWPHLCYFFKCCINVWMFRLDSVAHSAALQQQNRERRFNWQASDGGRCSAQHDRGTNQKHQNSIKRSSVEGNRKGRRLCQAIAIASKTTKIKLVNIKPCLFYKNWSDKFQM